MVHRHRFFSMRRCGKHAKPVARPIATYSWSMPCSLSWMLSATPLSLLTTFAICPFTYSGPVLTSTCSSWFYHLCPWRSVEHQKNRVSRPVVSWWTRATVAYPCDRIHSEELCSKGVENATSLQHLHQCHQNDYMCVTVIHPHRRNRKLTARADRQTTDTALELISPWQLFHLHFVDAQQQFWYCCER